MDEQVRRSVEDASGEYGKWYSVYRRFARWAAQLPDDRDMYNADSELLQGLA